MRRQSIAEKWGFSRNNSVKSNAEKSPSFAERLNPGSSRRPSFFNTEKRPSLVDKLSLGGSRRPSFADFTQLTGLHKLKGRRESTGEGAKAVFRKILSSAKNKSPKNPSMKIKSDKSNSQLPYNEDFESKKQEWQEELQEMSEFLYLKSTEEQIEEGVTEPVDTATIEDKDGLPYLKAVFDVHLFTEDEIDIQFEGRQLIMNAIGTEERDDRIYKRTMVRKLDLPKHVDIKMMHKELVDGKLYITMPFHLPPKKPPPGPNVFPIITDSEGRRKLRIMINIGSDFTPEDVSVEASDRTLTIQAKYNEDVGKYGKEVTAHEFNREYALPEHCRADYVVHVLTPDGRLFIEIYLKEQKNFKATVEREEVDFHENVEENGTESSTIVEEEETSSVCDEENLVNSQLESVDIHQES